MRKEELSVAVVQQDIRWEAPEENYALVEQMLGKLQHPVDIIVLPETFTTGFTGNMAQLAEPVGGPTLDFVQRLAKKYEAMVAASWVVRDRDGLCYNRMHLVAPDGRASSYDKAHTFRLGGEYEQIACGTRREIVEWRGWRLLPAVCYDLRFPRWLRNGYDALTDTLDFDLMIVVANWPASRIHAWDALLRARAAENLCYVVGCNRTGTDGMGLDYNGHSAIIDFAARPIAEGETDILVSTLSAAKLDTYRRHFPFYLDFDAR